MSKKKHNLQLFMCQKKKKKRKHSTLFLCCRYFIIKSIHLNNNPTIKKTHAFITTHTHPNTHAKNIIFLKKENHILIPFFFFLSN